MQNAGAQRRLAAVLAADVVGYSRLMQQDDQATLAALTGRRRLFAERAAAHGGRVVNAPGDSILAEFHSVVAAVECAIDQMPASMALRAPFNVCTCPSTLSPAFAASLITSRISSAV